MSKKTPPRGPVSEPPPPDKHKKTAGKTQPKIPLPAAASLVPPAAAEPGPQDLLLFANSEFYRSLTTGDLGAMTALWDHGHDTFCAHPSGVILREWPEIEASWRRMFEGNPPKVIPESEVLSIRGDTGVVFCVERIISADGMGLAGATNVFHRTGGGPWKMTWHHSALLPLAG